MRRMTPQGSATGLLIYEVLRIHGRLIAAGDALTADLGLTSARWQVLGTIGISDTDLTVPDLARILGQSRQSIQRLVNEMAADGLLEFVDNPSHKRSMLITLTEKGRRLNQEVEKRRIPWTEAIAAKLWETNARQPHEVLAALRRILDGAVRLTGG